MTPPPPAMDAAWIRRLDRLGLLLARVGRRLVGRPSDEQLQRLARQDRPGLEIALPPGSADQLAAGRRAFAEARYGEALHHFAGILAEDPDHPWAWHGRGDALQLLGSHEAAREAYARAAALQPGEPLHWRGQANALRSLGRPADAAEAEERARGLERG